MSGFDAFAYAQHLLTALGGPDALPPASGVRLYSPAGGPAGSPAGGPSESPAGGSAESPAEALLAGVWSALARPGALATNFRLVESGRQVDRSRWMRSRVGDGEVLHTTLVPAYLHSAIERGATLVISHIEALDERVMLLCEAIEYQLHARAWVNCYITAGDASAFDIHSDDHDALILQLLGRKHWQVDTRVGARSRDLAPDSLDRVLEPGTCLSVPRDTAHRVAGTGELTVHLTIGYEPFADLRDEALAAHELLGTSAAEPDREWLATRLAMRPDRRAGASLRSALTGEVGESTRIRWASRFPPKIRPTDDGLVVITMGRRIRLDRRLEATIGLLSRGSALTWPDLAAQSDLSAADLRDLVRFGARNDFLICEG
ncbi:JmjC domain-containing protein [Streptomyces sp. NPDC056773]|uniref:JmjC domain-containing protein n=1 Tax=unclassified Streptomyces TaxID=2593676 RepID=UPI003692C132